MTAKQQLFVDEYLIDLNATQAALRAGYSEKTARSIGAENLSKPDIEKAIADALEARRLRTEITQDRVLEELAAIAFAPATRSARGQIVRPPSGARQTSQASRDVHRTSPPHGRGQDERARPER